mmetsp:Transcript_39798/g.97561  ORF Transcript_39798/g.97561 Transcript_39798/m.97561 type:complete len:198 (-) Transcript_39798:346-939(-)
MSDSSAGDGSGEQLATVTSSAQLTRSPGVASLPSTRASETYAPAPQQPRQLPALQSTHQQDLLKRASNAYGGVPTPPSVADGAYAPAPAPDSSPATGGDQYVNMPDNTYAPAPQQPGGQYHAPVAVPQPVAADEDVVYMAGIADAVSGGGGGGGEWRGGRRRRRRRRCRRRRHQRCAPRSARRPPWRRPPPRLARSA